jgi:hypothetical protein
MFLKNLIVTCNIIQLLTIFSFSRYRELELIIYHRFTLFQYSLNEFLILFSYGTELAKRYEWLLSLKQRIPNNMVEYFTDCYWNLQKQKNLNSQPPSHKLQLAY